MQGGRHWAAAAVPPGADDEKRHIVRHRGGKSMPLIGRRRKLQSAVAFSVVGFDLIEGLGPRACPALLPFQSAQLPLILQRLNTTFPADDDEGLIPFTRCDVWSAATFVRNHRLLR
jgi:hypothetical protein